MAGLDFYCKFNYFGHCKFGNQCQKQHLQETCYTFPCKEDNCVKRHPRLCKFLMYFGTCKFKDACSFLHKPSHQEDLLIQEVEKLKVEIEQLRNGLIQTILNKLKTLENKVDDKEEVENTEPNSNIKASENSKEVFPCKSCDFKT